MTAFAGHASDSTSKAIYDTPAEVAPAERIYAADGNSDGKPDAYDSTAWTAQPGAAARANGYPQAL